MKRLLAYLFIVLGLGLTFNVNAYSKAPAKYICYGKYDNSSFYLDWYNWGYGYSWWDVECKTKGNLISKKKIQNNLVS